MRRCDRSMNRQVRDRGTGMRLTETVCYSVLYCIISVGGLNTAGRLLGIAFSFFVVDLWRTPVDLTQISLRLLLMVVCVLIC